MMYGLRNLQEMKWNILQDFVKNINFNVADMDFNLKINTTEIFSGVDFKKNYTSLKFLLVENQSSSFIVNSISFFIFYIPFVTVGFLLLKLLNKIIVKFSRFRFFERYSLYGYLLFLVMNGTV